MPLELAVLDRVTGLERGGDLSLPGIIRILVKLQLLDRDGEGRRLHFVGEPFHDHLARKQGALENDAEFLISRPIL